MSAAAAILEILNIAGALADAKPLFDMLKKMDASGATFEEILEAARNLAVTAEADAQAEINK